MVLSRNDKKQQERKTVVTFGQFILPLTVFVALAMLFFSVKLFFYTPLNPEESAVMEQEDKQIQQIISDKSAEKKEKAALETADNRQITKTAHHKTASGTEISDKQGTEEHVAIAAARPVSNPAAKNAVKNETVKTEKIAKPDVKKTNEKQVTAQSSHKRTLPAKTAEQQDKTSLKPVPVKHDNKKTNVKETGKNIADKAKTNAKTAEPQKALKTAENNVSSNQAAKRWDVQIGVFSDRKNADLLIKKVIGEGFSAYVEERDKICRVRVKGAADREGTLQISEKLKQKGYEVYPVEIK